MARTGRKNAPFFRIVAVDKRAKRDGASLEILGAYNPRTGEIVQYHADKVQAWIAKGAQMSDTVKKIHKKHTLAA